MDKEQKQRFERYTEIAWIAERPFVSTDLIRMVCGDRIGGGAFRAVYEWMDTKDKVIKIDVNSNANILEFEIWQAVKDTPYKKWFAPCYDLSPCGHYLIQKRCRPIKPSDKLPKKLPNVFTDIKKENWGFIGSQLVCHDYQFISRAIDCAFVTTRQVDWNTLTY